MQDYCTQMVSYRSSGTFYPDGEAKCTGQCNRDTRLSDNTLCRAKAVQLQYHAGGSCGECWGARETMPCIYHALKGAEAAL